MFVLRWTFWPLSTLPFWSLTWIVAVTCACAAAMSANTASVTVRVRSMAVFFIFASPFTI